MSNRLKNERSLYLRQHSDNPVDWYPWGAEALAAAEAQDKPLLVSVGYSACHWCHVMARESFADPYIAGLMNRHFVCVKVDREERPDVDQVFMDAVQMITRRGGWPLNVFCLPDGRPFFGGTYFPPKDRGDGMIPWPQLLMRIAEHYQRNSDDLEGNAKAICGNLEAANRPEAGGFDPALLVDAARGICGNHDDQYGGFGAAPKFPAAMVLNFLDTVSSTDAVAKSDPELAARIAAVRRQTLEAMAHGGIYDQLGGGFARYSTDAHWLVPHFEKMLYDNALLIEAYSRAWMGGRDPLFAAVVEESIGWLEREMTATGGGFTAAIDADSEGEEGRFYVWTPDEVRAELGSGAPEFCAAYHITEAGNFENGRSVPALVEPSIETRERLGPQRERLLEARRTKRSAPAKDPKVSLAWNCLTVRALAQAGFTFGRPDWMALAKQTADFLWDAFSREVRRERRIYSVLYGGEAARVDGFLHDYALAADAMLAVAAVVDWTEPGESGRYVRRATELVNTALKRFADGHPGFFFTAEDADTPVLRRKEWFDNATPSGNGALLHALAGLHAVTGEAAYADEITRLQPVYASWAGKAASAVAHGLAAICDHAKGIAVIKAGPGAPIDPLREAIIRRPWRRVFVLQDRSLPGGYQLCIGSTCLEPTGDPAEVAEKL